MLCLVLACGPGRWVLGHAVPSLGLWPWQVGPGPQRSGPISENHHHVSAQAPTQTVVKYQWESWKHLAEDQNFKLCGNLPLLFNTMEM